MNQQEEIKEVLMGMNSLLEYKNKKYGNSALSPLSIFGSHVSNNNNQGTNSILIRIDDKLNRIKNSDELKKNDCADLLGYLALLCVSKGWKNFEEFKDWFVKIVNASRR